MEDKATHRRSREDGIRTRTRRTCAVALFGIAAVVPASASNFAGVTDFTHAKITAIQVDDLTDALAATRGTRIEPAAPPTAHLPGFFEPSSAAIHPQARALLEKIGTALASSELAPFRFSIEWRVAGDAPDDSELSRERTEAVRDILVAQGVAENRLGFIGPTEADGASSLSLAERWHVALVNLGLVP